MNKLSIILKLKHIRYELGSCSFACLRNDNENAEQQLEQAISFVSKAIAELEDSCDE